MTITESYQRLREEVPRHVSIVLAAKKRSPEEVAEAIEAGAKDFGMNYVQEAEAIHAALGETARSVRWHMIGHLQKNKINKALPVFDMIQTVDSLENARAIDARVEAAGKAVQPVLLEVNIGDEDSKEGIRPDEYDAFEDSLEQLVVDVGALPHLKLQGLMTMAPFYGDPEACRPYFQQVRELYDFIRRLDIPGTAFRHLSMGMTDSYEVAIEEGSTMIRLGTAIFGPR